MSIPLSVRIGERDITGRADDLMFRKTVHGTAEIGLKLAEELTAEFRAYERVYVYDGTSADTLAEGWLEDPGRTLDDQGQQWDMSAVGAPSRTADHPAALIYVDTDLSRWLREQNLRATSGEASATNVPSNDKTDGLVMQYNPGQPIDKNSAIVMVYRAIEDAGMLVGSVQYTVVAGLVSALNYQARMWAEAGGTGSQVRSDGFDTVPNDRQATLSSSPTPLPAGTTAIQLITKRTGAATTVRNDNAWAAFYNVAVKAARYNLNGTLNTTQADYLRGVYAHEVVTDLLVRLLSGVYDVPNASIDTTSVFEITQLAYPDGVTPEQLLADLMEMLPDYYWQVGPSDPVTGKSSFTWRKWPTSPRYVASLRAGTSLPGGDAERYNQVTVRWTDSRGRIKTKTYDAGTTISGTFVPLVAELETAGPGGTRLVRAPDIQDLGDEVGSEAAADKFAAEFLLAHGTPPVSGTLTVAGRVFDNDLGRYVQPLEIEPGHLVFVPELATSVEDYPTTGRNGRSVFGIVGMTYTVSENTAELELDAPPRTDEVLLAQQISKRNRKR